jgi:GTP-binding protein
MAFIDEVKIEVTAGKGGHGCLSFHRARHLPLGGPNGGDGGDGGHVFLKVDSKYNTLSHLRRKFRHSARNGQPGLGSQKTGKGGEDCFIPVPVGTKIYDAEGAHFIRDLVDDGEIFMVARGGEGGLGNIHFRSSTNRSPRQFTQGDMGETRQIRLELQVLADVGLLGFPNAGKSTLLRHCSAARPSVASYPFTTLQPHLGVVDASPTSSFVMADIPGLIEGAAEGVGLGTRFLKHLSRCQCLLHLVALSSEDPDYDPIQSWQIVNKELAEFSEDLVRKPQVLVLTKSDLMPEIAIDAIKDKFVIEGLEKSKILVISCFTQQGIKMLINHLSEIVQQSHIENI